MTKLERPNFFAITKFRLIRKPVGIRARDRLSHMYVIGKTGTGKTTMLQTMILQDIYAGAGICVLDPHGDLLEGVMQQIPESRKDDVIYIDVSDINQPWGYNPLKRVRADKRPLAASGFLEVMKMLWHGREWGVRMEHILRNSLMALMDQPHATLPDVLRLLTDNEYRKEVVENIENRQVKNFWEKEFPKYAQRMKADGIAPIQNKIGAFLANPSMYKMIAEPEKVINFRNVMDEGKILLINLAKGKIGSDASNLLGGLIVTTVGLAAYSRAEIPEEERRSFYFYVDEFQNYSTLSFANMLAELRKYKVGMVLANQYLFQLEAGVRHAVLGNCGTLVCFRVGPECASLLAKEFAYEGKHKVEPYDLVIARNYLVHMKLMIDGKPSEGFTATTIANREDIHNAN